MNDLINSLEQDVLCSVAQSCLTFCDIMDCSTPGSFVHGDSPGKNTGEGCQCPLPGDLPNLGIEPRSPALQADFLPAEPQGSPVILEWVAYPFSRGPSRPRN